MSNQFIEGLFTQNIFLFIHVRGKKLIELPYTVKGMDVSFSGILSYIEVNACLSNAVFTLDCFTKVQIRKLRLQCNCSTNNSFLISTKVR